MGRERLAARRRSLGHTQEALAYELDVDVSTVARWERGEATPRLWNRRPLADALGLTVDQLDDLLQLDDAGSSVPPTTDEEMASSLVAADWDAPAACGLRDAIVADEDLTITAGEAPRLVHLWLVVDPPQTVELRAGRRIGKDLAVQVARRVEHLRRLDDYLAGTDLQGAIDREMAATTALVSEATYNDTVGRILLTALGDLCQLAGWAAADAGRDDAVTRYYLTGIAAAHAAGDRPLAGQLISSLAYYLANAGRPRDAVLLAQSALTGTRGHSTATTRALFLERLAWGYAKTHDRRQTERTLGLAEEAYANRDPEDDPEWVYWLTSDEIDVMAGRCSVELGLPERARPRLERALASYSDDRPREAALYLSWLAEADLQAGDVDQAATVTSRVLDLAGHTASTRTTMRVDHLRHLLQSHRGRPAVEAFEEHYWAVRA